MIIAKLAAEAICSVRTIVLDAMLDAPIILKKYKKTVNLIEEKITYFQGSSQLETQEDLQYLGPQRRSEDQHHL